MKIITGKTQSDHVNSEDDRALHAGTFGKGSYVLNVGTKLNATIESSNTIRLDCGELVHQGTHARIPYGTYDTATIDNGTTGYMRKDLIVARYEKNGGFETVSIETIKGIPSVSDPIAPDYEYGNILEGAEISDMPLYEVLLNGVNIESVTSLFKICTGLDDVYRKNEVYMKNDVYNKQEINNKESVLKNGISNAQTSADNAKTSADNAQSSANNAQTTANNAQSSADNAMTMAKKGLVLVVVMVRNVELTAGSSGIISITNIGINIDVPQGTEYVAVIVKGITNGANVKSVSATVNGTSCTISGEAQNAEGTKGNVTLEILCFARPENI